MRKIFVVVTAVSSFFAGAVQAQTSATQSATASVSILQPITLTKNADLAFGKLVKPTSGANTLTLSTSSDTPTLTGPGDAALAASTASRAAFTVGGEGGQAFSITVPGAVTMTKSGGVQTLAVTLTSSATSGTLSGSIGSAGTASFTVGGSFQATAGTASGAYSGAFNTIVAYN